MGLELVKELLPKNISKSIKESYSVQEDVLKTLMFHAPMIIKSKRDNERALEIIRFLVKYTKKIDDTKLQEKAIYFMSELTSKIAEFEKGHRSLEETTPATLLKSFMEDFHLTPKDFEKELGSADLVRKIISGKREISKQGAINLGKRFSVSPALFLGV